MLLVLDDAHHLGSADSAELVMRLARGLSGGHRLLVAARSLVASLEGLWALEGAVRLDTSALAFTTEEAAQLIESRLGHRPPPHDARLLVEATDGWATALAVAARGYGVDGVGALTLPRGPDLIAAPLRGTLGALRPGDRQALVQLAHLPFLSPRAV